MTRAVYRLAIFILACLAYAPPFARGQEGTGFERVEPDPSALEESRQKRDEKKEDDEAPANDEGLNPWDQSVARGLEDVATLGDRLGNLTVGVDVLPYGFSRDKSKRNVTVRIFPKFRVPFLKKGAINFDSVNYKLGRFYVDMTDLTLSVLSSDNVFHTEKNRKSDTIASASLGVNLLFELTDESHLSANGALVWLPFENEFGVDGFGIRDIYSLGLAGLLDAGLFLDGRVGGVDVILQDELKVRDNRLESELSGDFSLYDGEDFAESDTAGDYSFGGNQTYDPYFDSDTSDLEDDDTIEIVNTASLTALKEVMEDSTMSLTGFYRNYWYPDRPDKDQYLITREYGLNGSWIFNREDWRFNPFAYYSQVWNNIDQGWLYTARIGAQGPVTNRIHLYGDVGWGRAKFMGYDDEFLWRLAVNHDISPVTNQRLLYERRFEGRTRSLQKRFRYELQHIFSNRLRGGVFGGWTDYHLSDRTDYLLDTYGAEYFVQVTPIVGYLQEVIFQGYDYDDNSWNDTEYYRSTITYIVNKNSYFAFTYTHKFQQGNNNFNSYRENLFTLSWTYKL